MTPTPRPMKFLPMFHAALSDGTKSQHRAPVKEQPDFEADACNDAEMGGASLWFDFWACGRSGTKRVRFPFGKVGDRLRVPGTDIELTITEIRVERLQEISEGDAIAEGVERQGVLWKGYGATSMPVDSPRTSFRLLWECIYGPGSWDASPWVWVITFKRKDQDDE